MTGMMRSIWTRVRNSEARADPVQQAGGGEQPPVAAVSTPPITTEEAPAPKEEKPAPESIKVEESVVEAKDDTLPTVSDNVEVLPTSVAAPQPEPLQKETKEEEKQTPAPQAEENVKLEEIKEEVKAAVVDIAPVPQPNEQIQNIEEAPKETEDWQKRESELLKKIEELEKVKSARSEDGLRLELKLREEEIDLLKARVKNLETELQAALSKPGGKNHEIIESIKQQHEELLSKARGMIFDKTKMVKNQELQIEALTTQVQSLKDINLITKDLLEIRNSEVKAMEERFQAMEARFKAEKERYDLVLKRAQTSTNINDDLRKEYETQLAIFKELREKYELRVQALVAENNRLKEAVKGPGTSG